MKTLTFPGGIHPPKNKNLIKEAKIQEMPLPAKVILPLGQHIGAPAVSCVAKNDEVKTGQVIAEAGGFVSAPVHAAISGKVVDIKEMPHPVFGKGKAIIIESDEKDEWVELEGVEDWTSLSNDEIKEKVKNAGLVGLGGATFPTHVKLSPPAEKPIDTVILNGAECEPYLRADDQLMIEEGEGIITGLKIVMKVLGARIGYIGIEDDKKVAIVNLKKILKSGKETDIKVVALEAKYPQGAEKHLIKVILNKEVPSGGLPMDVGVVVQNVGTALAITQAVTLGRPLIDRIVTVTGDGVNNPKNLRVRLGTPFADIINEAGGLRGTLGKIIMGGPMMGMAQYTTEVPVIKGTSGILVLSRAQVQSQESAPCLSCGKCVFNCPMNLMPSIIGLLVENEKFLEAKEMNLLDCIECGCCSYVCPAKRPLVHLFKYGKAELAKKK
ncbi:electron transport complex subunit RsxC [bacterium]|nr:electron transport complex subunit RsxC [bacterium]MBU1614779.1 electron transport complex subunit RsxC [bacterium]